MLHDRAHQRGRMVFEFGLHDAVPISPPVIRTGCDAPVYRSRRHRRHIARFEQEEPGRRRARPRRTGPCDHRHRAAEDLFHNFAGSIHQPPRRADTDQQCVVVFALGLCDSRRHQFIRDRRDRAIDIQLQHPRSHRGGKRQSGNRGQSRTTPEGAQDQLTTSLSAKAPDRTGYALPNTLNKTFVCTNVTRAFYTCRSKSYGKKGSYRKRNCGRRSYSARCKAENHHSPG